MLEDALATPQICEAAWRRTTSHTDLAQLGASRLHRLTSRDLDHRFWNMETHKPCSKIRHIGSGRSATAGAGVYRLPGRGGLCTFSILCWCSTASPPCAHITPATK